MTKKIISAIMALTIMAGLTIPASAANDNTTNSDKRYYIDLEMATDQEFEECGVELEFVINGKTTTIKADGTVIKSDGTTTKDDTLGNAVLFDYRPNGKLDQDSMPITFIPLRLCVSAFADYGVKIDWDDTTKNVVLDTAKGRIQFPIGATSITAPDGTKYEEQTYRFPNGDPINVVSMRANRTYTTVRFLSTFLMPDATFKWKGTERLTITGTMEKSEGVEKTYGINKNYISEYGGIDFEALPTLAEVAKSVGAEVDSYVLKLESIDKYGGTNRLHINTDKDGTINVSGYNTLGVDESQLKVLEAMLTDLINDADKDSIMVMLKNTGDKLMEGWNEDDGITQAAKDWMASTEKEPITLNEVVFTWQPKFYMSSFTIKTK